MQKWENILPIHYTVSRLRNPIWNQSISRGSLSGYWQPLSRGPAPPTPAQSTAAQHLAATSATSCHVPGSRGSDCRIMPLYPAWTCLCYRVIPRLSQQLHGVAIAIIDYPDSIRNQDVPKIVNKHGKTVKNIFISGMVSSYVFRRIPSRVME